METSGVGRIVGAGQPGRRLEPAPAQAEGCQACVHRLTPGPRNPVDVSLQRTRPAGLERTEERRGAPAPGPPQSARRGWSGIALRLAPALVCWLEPRRTHPDDLCR